MPPIAWRPFFNCLHRFGMIPQLQTNNSTFYGRHWNEAQVLRRYVPSDLNLSILSFGCSTGEELVLLRKLFPAARVFGCEHDWSNLLAARSLLGRDAVIFDSTPAAIASHGPFDIIMCNSVLMAPTVNGPNGPVGLPATLWGEMVEMLDASLVEGGILQMINSNFAFRLHPVAADYVPLRSPLLLGANFADQYALDGRKLCSGVSGVGLSPLLNVHLGDADCLELWPEDLTDVHFQKRGGSPVLPVLDQILPNMLSGPVRGSGESVHRAAIPDDGRPASYVEVQLAWNTVGADGVRLRRTVSRVWFDGSKLPPIRTTIDLQGPGAAAFFESTLGRASTRLTLAALESQHVRHSPMS